MQRMQTSILLPACFCTAFATAASAQTEASGASERISLNAASRSLYSSLNSNRREELEKAGILNRNGPYRVALPLASFGENGPKLLFTYIPRMKDNSGSKVFMFYVKMELQ
jgi:hypothetical protein